MSRIGGWYLPGIGRVCKQQNLDAVVGDPTTLVFPPYRVVPLGFGWILMRDVND